MNNYKLEKLMEAPSKEGMRQHLKESGEFWDYKDRRCRYHSRVYGRGHKFADKLLDKNVGKSFSQVVKVMKNNPRYKHSHFFRLGIDTAVRDVVENAYRYSYWRSAYYFAHNSDVILKRDKRRYVPKNKERSLDFIEYVDGTIVERRNGIYYFLLSSGYYDHIWSKQEGDYVLEEILPTYWQLSKAWLKFYKLENNPI